MAYIKFLVYGLNLPLNNDVYLIQIEYEERKKAEGKKARDDKEAVLNMLFAAFEKHQYYNIKDLQKVLFFLFFL